MMMMDDIFTHPWPSSSTLFNHLSTFVTQCPTDFFIFLFFLHHPQLCFSPAVGSAQDWMQL